MVESLYEPNFTILLAFYEYTIYWEHVDVKRLLDGATEIKQSGIYRLIMRSCTVIDCKKIIFGMKPAPLRSYYFKTSDQTFIRVQGDNEVVPLYKQSNYYNIVFVEIYHYEILILL